MNNPRESGQVGLVVLLVGAVLMTIGLGVASQSVIQTKTARQETASTFVFDAAEQGLEQALKGIVGSSPIANPPSGTTGTFRSEKTQSFAGEILTGHSATVNVAGATNIEVAWAPNQAGCAQSAALELTLMSSLGYARSVLVPGGCTLGFINGNMGTLTSSPLSLGYYRSSSISTAGMTLARIKVLGPSTIVRVTGTGLPDQGTRVKAFAQSIDGASETTAVTGSLSLAAAPSIFDYVLFSGSGNIAVSP